MPDVEVMESPTVILANLTAPSRETAVGWRFNKTSLGVVGGRR